MGWLCFSLVVLSLLSVGRANFAIPGTTQTINGYDTELGEDSICWKSFGTNGTETSSNILFANPLVEQFVLEEKVELLRECPDRNALHAWAPLEFQRGERLRTKEWYNYTVDIDLNITSLGGNSSQFVSDDGPRVAIQILVCELGVAGFCSPFVHEEANERLADLGESEETKQGDRHGGSHVHSAFTMVHLKPEDGPIYKIQEEIPMLVNEPGSFFAIGAIQMYLGNDDTPVHTRWDMANALEGQHRLLAYQEPAEVLEVPDSVRVVSYVAIFIVASVIVYLLFRTVQHRKHQVLRLTQGRFLIVFLIAALAATIASAFLEPKNDLYCRVGRPIIMCSAQLIYAITLGRLWRIHSVISPLLAQTLRQEQGYTYRFFTAFRRLTQRVSNTCFKQPNQKNLRRQVSEWQLALVVVLFTLPQVILQFLSVFVDVPKRNIDFNEDESKGRAECNCGSDATRSYEFLGSICFVILVIVLLLAAHTARGLPSLFNETRDIFDATVTTLMLLVLGVGILAVTNGPTTSPAVPYLVGVTLTLSITLNTSVRIMMPKLKMIRRGEIVLVSKLVSDHRQSVERKNEMYRNRKDGAQPKRSSIISGLDTTNNAMNCEFSTTLDSGDLTKSPERSPRTRSWRKPFQRKIMVQNNKTPARRLVLPLLEYQNHLSFVNQRIMSGLVVTEKDWERLRTLSLKMGNMFGQEVTFDWEVDEEEDNNGLKRLTEIPSLFESSGELDTDSEGGEPYGKILM